MMRIPAILFLAIGFSLQFLNAEDLEVVDVPKDASDFQLRSLNVGSVTAGAHLELKSAVKKEEDLQPDAMVKAIDPDRTSGINLQKNNSYEFLMTMDHVEDVQKLTVSGDLQGAKVSVKMNSSPLESKDGHWDTVVSEKTVDSNTMEIPIVPRESYQALIQVDTSSVNENTQPILRDISTYGSKSQGDYQIQPKDPTSQSASQNSLTPTGLSRSESSTPINLATSLTGSSVLAVSPSMNSEKTEGLIDDNPSTSVSVPAGKGTTAVVLDLGTARNINKLGLTHSPSDGSVKAFIYEKNPVAPPPKTPPSGLGPAIVIFSKGKIYVLRLKPSALLKAKASELPQPVLVAKGGQIQPGDVIQTGNGSGCQLQFENGCQARVGPNTTCSVIPNQNGIKLIRGECIASSNPGSGQNCFIQDAAGNICSTSNGTICVRSGNQAIGLSQGDPDPRLSPFFKDPKLTSFTDENGVKWIRKGNTVFIQLPFFVQCSSLNGSAQFHHPDGATKSLDSHMQLMVPEKKGALPEPEKLDLAALIGDSGLFEFDEFPPIRGMEDIRKTTQEAKKKEAEKTPKTSGEILKMIADTAKTPDQKPDQLSEPAENLQFPCPLTQEDVTVLATVPPPPSRTPGANLIPSELLTPDAPGFIGKLDLNGDGVSEMELTHYYFGRYIIFVFTDEDLKEGMDLSGLDLLLYDLVVLGDYTLDDFELVEIDPSRRDVVAQLSNFEEQKEQGASSERSIDPSKVSEIISQVSTDLTTASPSSP